MRNLILSISLLASLSFSETPLQDTLDFMLEEGLHRNFDLIRERAGHLINPEKVELYLRHRKVNYGSRFLYDPSSPEYDIMLQRALRLPPDTLSSLDMSDPVALNIRHAQWENSRHIVPDSRWREFEPEKFSSQDGFYASAMAGTGLGNFSGFRTLPDSKSQATEIFGLTGQFSFKAGISLLDGQWTLTADAVAAGVSVLDEGPEYDMTLVGLGAAYNIKPWNTSLSATFGRTSSTFIDTSLAQAHDHGLGYKIQICNESAKLFQRDWGYVGLAITGFYAVADIHPSATSSLYGSTVGLNINLEAVLNPSMY